MKKLSVLIALLAAMAVARADCRPKPPADVVAYVPVCPPGYVCAEALHIAVQWSDVAKTETGYVVDRAAVDVNGLPLEPFQRLAVLPKGSEFFTDWSPLWGIPVVYRVGAVNRCGVNYTYFVFEP